MLIFILYYNLLTCDHLNHLGNRYASQRLKMYANENKNNSWTNNWYAVDTNRSDNICNVLNSYLLKTICKSNKEH